MTPQQRRLQAAASVLLEVLDETIPRSTIHWVVEQTRQSVRTLQSYADTVQTHDARGE